MKKKYKISKKKIIKKNKNSLKKILNNQIPNENPI